MKYECRLCGWVGYQEDLEPETIYYEVDGEIISETYESKCPNCHDFEEVYPIDEKRLYKV